MIAAHLDSIIAETKQKADKLISSPKWAVRDLPTNMPVTGIYLFSEKSDPLYVGRTNRLRRRIQYHTRNSHHQATFAFLLARHATGRLKASYRSKGSRSDLLNNTVFRRAFDEARQRIRAMEVQFIEETDPVKQALLEVFVAYHTKAAYNSFDNH